MFRKRLLDKFAFKIGLAAILLSCIYNLDGSSNAWGATSNISTKYAPLILIQLSLSIFFITGQVRESFRIAAIPIYMFFIYSLCGSLFVISTERAALQYTYLGRSLTAIYFFWGACIFSSNELRELVKDYLPKIIKIFSLIMMPLLVLYQFQLVFPALTQIYHENIGILIAAYPYWGAAGVIFITSGIITKKATGTIISIAAICLLLFNLIAPKNLQLRKKVLIVIISAGIFVAAIAMTFASSILHARVNQGAPVRAYTYNLRIEEFKGSPLFGDAFTLNPLITVGSIEVPTHSDFLDILSGGGLLGTGCFLIPFIFAIGKFLSGVFFRVSNKEFIFFGVVLFSLFITMLFNPILGVQHYAIFYWISMAYFMVEPRKRRLYERQEAAS